MIWSDLRGNTESQAETSWPLTQIAFGSNNVNGPKVLASLSKIWLFAGKSENPALRGSQSLRVTTRQVQIISRKGQQRKLYWNPQRLYARFQP